MPEADDCFRVAPKFQASAKPIEGESFVNITIMSGARSQELDARTNENDAHAIMGALLR
jgi:hypothetical protein